MLYFSPGMLVVTTLLSLAAVSISDSPPANTIPVVSIKTGQDVTCTDITMDVLLMLLWHNFDGIWVEGKFTDYLEAPADYCDSTQAIMIAAPGPLQGLNNWPPTRWGRYSSVGIESVDAFIHPDPDDFKVIADSATAAWIINEIEDRANAVHGQVSDHPCVWYFDIFNEAPARQLGYMLNDTSSIDDYFPSMFTQDTNMTQVLPDGIFAWEKWKSDELYGEDGPTVSVCHSMLHSIDSLEWAGISPGFQLGNPLTQSNSVNAYFSMRYLQYDPSSSSYDTLDNTPSRLDLNAYPIRCAGYTWQTNPAADSITVLGSATDLWMLEHYELLMDSTFIPAGDHENGPFPINYHVQSFGRTGGRAIWDVDTLTSDTIINYEAYAYRIPSPAEFRMLCNIGLLRGAKGVFPYSIRSNSGGFGIPEYPWLHDTGLLDENLIPFDAPYENWVYRDRPTADFYYAPPDSIPPWTAADGSQFDPFYTVPDRPTTSTTDPKYMKDYLEWKFTPYARLWNSVRGTFGQIARVAPELSGLWWWFTASRFDNAFIEYDGTEPQYFADPHIRVFTDSTESTCYLFYVNRFCRANDNPFEITISNERFPENTPFSEYALDHSRRFLIHGSEPTTGDFEFLDTLDAGEARLLQMFDSDSVLPADIRITDPDLSVILPTKGDTLLDYRSAPGTPVNILARFYNMGTASTNYIWVYLYDETDEVFLDTTRISFNGLSTSSCYTADSDLTTLSWTPGRNDIGVHILKVYTEQILDEPDPTDNSASLVYVVNPKDYATEVLGDPWDMTEATTSIPDWHTNDIDSLLGWESTFSDSISGMFEGTVSDDNLTTNRMYLHIPADTSEWIDGGTYNQFSITGKSQRAALVTLCWEDSLGSSYSILVDTITSEYQQSVILDLNSTLNWISYPNRLVWLRFSPVTGVVALPIRIGNVSLTE